MVVHLENGTMNNIVTILRYHRIAKSRIILNLLMAVIFPSLSIFAQANYLKGQILDDQGHGLSNLRLDLQHRAASFVSGSQGYFGITTPHKFDTLIIYYGDKDTIRRTVNAGEFNTVVIRSEKLLSTRNVRKLSSLSISHRHISPRSSYLANESYSTTIENPFFGTEQFSSTALALSYNRASYSNVRRLLNMNQTVPSDAVRLEEMLNYFSWNYEEPSPGQTFRMNTRLAPCPWNRETQLLFMHISSKKLDLERLPPSHLVFLIDISGSMNLPNRLPLLKSAFRVLVNNLRSRDTVSIVAYGGSSKILLNAISGSEKERITNVIDSLQPAGNTPGESGIKLAYRLAKLHYIKGGNNRVILATDGDFNVGVRTEDELEQMISLQKDQGIYLTCLGVGMGDYKDSKIQALAQKGSGNFAYLDSYAEAEKVLYREFFQTLYTVADNVEMHVQFNQDLVKEYRLIGYDNKIASLRDKQATIQGGEVGAGNSLMVVFEVKPRSGATSGNLAEVNIFYDNKSGERDRFTTSVSPARTEFSQLPAHFRMASAILMFGMKVKGSSQARNIKWDQILSNGKTAARAQSYSEQEFLQLIHQARMVYKKQRRFLFF
jgi:Ca-activated chloride channel family protein